MLQNHMEELEMKEKQANQRLFQDRDVAIGLLQEVSISLLDFLLFC